MMPRRVLATLAAIVVMPAGAVAQATGDSLRAAAATATAAAAAAAAPDALTCGPGVTAHLRAGDDTLGAASVAAGVATVARSIPRDTVITLAITDRTWTRDDVRAGVALGATGTSGVRSAPWRACAGATVHLGRVTARLRNVNGSVRLRIEPGALESIGRTTPPASPAVPPRR